MDDRSQAWLTRSRMKMTGERTNFTRLLSIRLQKLSSQRRSERLR